MQVLTWLALPFFQVYSDAGDFTVGGRCMTSLKENGLLYGLAGAAGEWGGGKAADGWGGAKGVTVGVVPRV
jgi:hypothetical protein